MSHNVENLNGIFVDCMSVDFHGRPCSLSRFSQAGGQVMDGMNTDVSFMVHLVYCNIFSRGNE